jgi:hypothetical protein
MASPNFDGDDDAALRYAIELSLQEAGRTSKQEPIQISSDDEDSEDLEKPPRYRPPIEKIKDVTSTATPPPSVPPSSASTNTTSGLALLGLDRKKMEEERLARLGKRKASDSGLDDMRQTQKPKSIPTTSTAEAIPTARKSQPSPANASMPISSDRPKLEFAKGAVKKTWAFGHPRTGDDIKIEEILQKRDLELAVLSSYQWDDEWLLSKIDMSKTKMVFVAFAKDKQAQDEMRANVPKGIIRFCFPPMLPYGAMHSKLQILKFSTYLRIVVPSGNLVPYDWGETGVMENVGSGVIISSMILLLVWLTSLNRWSFLLTSQGLKTKKHAQRIS